MKAVCTVPPPPVITAPSLTRRRWLQASGQCVIGFCLAPALATAASGPGPGPEMPPAPGHKPVGLGLVDSYLVLDRDGLLTLYTGKVELGTGVLTALGQMACEELSWPWDRWRAVQGDTDLTPDQGITYGSQSIQVGGLQIREAAATARQALLGVAARQLKVPASTLEIGVEGAVPRHGKGPGLPLAALLDLIHHPIPVDPEARPKAPAHYRLSGRSMPRVDIPDKVTGRFTFMQQLRVEGVVHARVIRPTGRQATLLAVDDRAARQVPGFIATVRRHNFLAVVCTTEWGAVKASRALRATWSDWADLPEQSRLWEHVRSTRVLSSHDEQDEGDAAQALREPGAQLISARYDFAIHTHGSIGPSCAVAEFKNGQLTCWTASQGPHQLRLQLARMLNLPLAKVRCIYVEGAGSYGRNGHEDAAADAALLAREIGQPVRVQWMRADEHGWDPKSPPVLLELRAALDIEGGVMGWHAEAYLPVQPPNGEVALLAGNLADLSAEPSNAGGMQRDLPVQYDFPNRRATVHWLENTPFRAGWLRTPGRMQNSFAIESFVDEIAAQHQLDPLAFRMRHLKDARGLELLARLKRFARWQPRTATRLSATARLKAGEQGLLRGRGVSYVKYEGVRTYVGLVADVEVDLRSGRIRVTDLHVVQDCGQIINPDGVRNQIEGNMLQTVSRTLIEEIRFDRSHITSLDWASYPILTFPDVPRVHIELIDRPDQPPWGVGEPSAALVPSAIANAVFDATGLRLRSVPFLPEKVLAAQAQVPATGN